MGKGKGRVVEGERQERCAVVRTSCYDVAEFVPFITTTRANVDVDGGDSIIPFRKHTSGNGCCSSQSGAVRLPSPRFIYA